MNIEEKTDCRFFTTEKGSKACKALTELVCRRKQCTFYQIDTEERQEAEDIEKE